jgi:hypothetical protein
VYCEDNDTTYTFLTEYFIGNTELIETVPCGQTQETSPDDFPAIPAGKCRYIYRTGGGFGQRLNAADACKFRFWWGYIDVDPCAPEDGDLTMVEDTDAAVNNAAIDDCDPDNPPGCRPGCDTDVDDCFSSPPVVSVSFAP